jgi:DNA ligase (NAD+)
MSIKEKANDEYYNTGEIILTDQEFDLISDHGLETVNFRNKVDHIQPMGSLKKIKSEEDYQKWCADFFLKKVSPKLDGNSIEMVFEDGKLIQAITRGDGFIGNDVTDKVKYCNYQIMSDGSHKAEAIMPKKFQTNYDKNIRNVVAGAIGRKTAEIEDLNIIDIVFFDDLGSSVQSNVWAYSELESIFNELKSDYMYEIDGLVVELSQKRHEEKDPLLPSNTIALKFNKEGVDAEVCEIEWNLGKYGRLTPVLILKEKVQIDDTMVGRVSASNYGLLKEAGVGVGAKVQVIKSGDIIPFISKVVSKSKQHLMFPHCPNCESEATISENGIHAICENCKFDKLTKLEHMFNIFDMEYVSDSTVENLYNHGYTDLESYFSPGFRDAVKAINGFGSSKVNNIIRKLQKLKITDAQALECTMIQGFGNKQCQRLINHYGGMYKMFASDLKDLETIDGFGDILSEKIRGNVHLMKEMVDMINGVDIEIIFTNFTVSSVKTKGNVVLTGKCEQYGRKELAQILEEKGYVVQSVINKTTNMLLTDNPDTTSSKGKKANKLNINIKTYKEFFSEKSIS